MPGVLDKGELLNRNSYKLDALPLHVTQLIMSNALKDKMVWYTRV